jgi:Cu(I)/Ag(I) efflux system membrane protein CusA/SilA
MVKQYQIQIDPEKLRAFGIPLSHVQTAINRGNQESGASVIEMAEAEYMVLVDGYLSSIDDIKTVPLGLNENGTPILLKDIADINLGPQMRRGLAELNGEGEVVGGIVVMRYGENAAEVIRDVKAKIEELKAGLPEGVEIITVYDRSALITRAVNNLWEKLFEEFVVVALIFIAFLFHFRSSLVAIISLPVGVLAAFTVMNLQGINANIMSLGGIAIAIGAMIDGATVMIENMHKKLELAGESASPKGLSTSAGLTDANRWRLVAEAAGEVGPALFFSLLIITLSFLPVFALEAQEGKMFAPLAFTKTYAMAASALLSITLVPVLMGYLIRGKIMPEQANPLNRSIARLYRPAIKGVLAKPKLTMGAAVLITLGSVWPAGQIGSEFIPPLDEGDLMYMPTTFPGISIGKARELLQQTDKLLKTVPEVDTVFGKMGRAETATDPAPLTMIETFIQLKPRSEWREGITTQDLIDEMNSLVTLPGLTNAFVMPIKTRIDMLATGIKTPVGIKIAGPDLTVIQRLGQEIERSLAGLPGTASVYSERVAGGRYIKVDILRDRAARYGLNVADIQQIVTTAIGGINISETVEGLERYPIQLRYPQAYRDSLESVKVLPLLTPDGQRIALADVANVFIEDGPPSIRSENARLNGWTLIDIENVDIGTYVRNAKQVIAESLELPPGYSLSWSGQFEYMERAKERLTLVIPFTLAIITLLLFANFRHFAEVFLILGTLPLGLVGGFWLMYFAGYNFSVAVSVGFIALAGVAVEIGVIMMVYLNKSYHGMLAKCASDSVAPTRGLLLDSVVDGAVLRVRPVMMTAVATIAGLIPIVIGVGTGSEVMSRIALPMVGGMLSAVVLTLLVLPCAYYLWRCRSLAVSAAAP